ncbi:MAG: methyltransferase domain-containing protein [Actinomycetota bacterium]|nr:methyltransferase domain-containing protein [Actinomycetota bacterium]
MDHSQQLLDYAARMVAPRAQGRMQFVAGDLRALPFPDDAFDAAFIGNCLAYANNRLELLAELRRVTRPGGRVAAKDYDGAVLVCHPLDPALTARVLAATATRLSADGATAELDNFVGRKLPSMLRQAGLADVRIASYAVQKTAPLAPEEHRYLKATADWYAEVASPHLATEDLQRWRAAFDPQDQRCILNHPDFYVCMLEMVATGLA